MPKFKVGDRVRVRLKEEYAKNKMYNRSVQRVLTGTLIIVGINLNETYPYRCAREDGNPIRSSDSDITFVFNDYEIMYDKPILDLTKVYQCPTLK